MKASIRSVSIYAAFMIAAAGVAYLVGQQRELMQLAAIAVSNKSARNVPSIAAPNVGSPNPAKLTRNQALERIKTVLETPNGVLRSWLIIMDQLDPADIPDLIEQINGLPRSDDRDFMLVHLLLGLEKPDLLAAFALTGKMANPSNHDNAINDIFSFMETQDPAIAMSELAQLPPGQTAQTAYQNFFKLWAAANSSSGTVAAAAAFALPASPERTASLQGLGDGWSNQNPQAAFDWASTLPPADVETFAPALMKISKQQPALVGQYVNIISDATVRNQIIQSVARSWAFAKQDSYGALKWLDQVATGDTYDNNVIFILNKLSTENPAAAASMAAKVTEPGVRDAVIASVAANWGKSDPQAAQAWLQTLPDSDANTRDAAIQKLIAAQAGDVADPAP